MINYLNRLPLILIGILFANIALSQNVYFINHTNREVYIIKRTILEQGSYPYTLVKDDKKVQIIPLQTTDAAIYNINMQAANGSSATSWGRLYLLKPNDTIIVANKNGVMRLTHQSSTVRTGELAMGENLIDEVPVKPPYTLEFFKLSALNTTLPIAKRNKIIDSLSTPVINYIAQYSRTNHIAPETEKLYKYNFMGMRYEQELNLLYNTDNQVIKKQLEAFYKDSVSRWAREFNCDNCSNIPFYNKAAKKTFDLLYKNLAPAEHLKAIASNTKGNTRNFLLSAYIADRIEDNSGDSGDMTIIELNKLIAIYNNLCDNSIYKKIVADNHLLASSVVPKTKNGLALLMTADKKQVDFNEMLKANKGNIIYIDFWASWCHPCLQEIPFSLNLHGKIKTVPIKMVYISIDRDFDNWIKMAKTQQINGTNSYVLVNAGKDGLSKLLSLSSIPRYLIVGKDGKFINTDASRPSDARTYQLLTELAKK